MTGLGVAAEPARQLSGAVDLVGIGSIYTRAVRQHRAENKRLLGALVRQDAVQKHVWCRFRRSEDRCMVRLRGRHARTAKLGYQGHFDACSH
jgi:hypothetical protein